MTNKDIYRCLGNLDPELIMKAAPAEKVQNRKRNNWMKWASIAACLLLIVGAFIAVPMLREDDPSTTTDNENTESTMLLPQIGKIEFDSLDKVNFYGGLKVIADADPKLSANSFEATPISHLSSEKKSRGIWASLTQTSPTSTGDPSSTHGNQSAYAPAWNLSGERMTITTAVYFRINVTEADTLLSEEIGIGEAEVVVTDLCIGINPFAMITFKNGDRFFSCLSEMYALNNGKNSFGSHLYIKGFGFFKDPVGDVTSFYTLELDMDNQAITSFTWNHYNRRPSESVLYNIELVPESIRISHETYEFTLDELSAYWQGEEDSIVTPIESGTVAAPMESDTAIPSESVEALPYGTIDVQTIE